MAAERPTFPPGVVPRLERMLITNHFVLIHVPRTGGNFIRELCFEHLPRDSLVRNALQLHTPYEEIADDFADLPMICFVRNPWDWYVSWYHHQMQHYEGQRSGRLWGSAFENGRASFRDLVVNACTLAHYENPETEPIMRARDIDHYTARFAQVTGSGIESGHIEVGRYESLREDFLAFLERHGVPVSAELSAAVSETPARHASERGDYRHYYDDALRDLLAQKARHFVEAYGYAF
jgi:Sulfotransferase domain